MRFASVGSCLSDVQVCFWESEDLRTRREGVPGRLRIKMRRLVSHHSKAVTRPSGRHRWRGHLELIAHNQDPQSLTDANDERTASFVQPGADEKKRQMSMSASIIGCSDSGSARYLEAGVSTPVLFTVTAPGSGERMTGRQSWLSRLQGVGGFLWHFIVVGWCSLL